MATSLVVPNSALLKLNWAGPTRGYQNVLGLRWTVGPVVPDQAMTDAIFTAIKARAETTALLALMGTNIGFQNVSLKDINTANRPEFTANGTPATGSGVGDTLPLSTATCITLRTQLAGKSFRGRVYIAGFTEAQNDVTGRALAAVNTAAVNFINGINTVVGAQGYVLAVLSRNSPGRTIPEKVIPAKAGFSTAVSAVLSRNNKWESQRRRTGRV